MFSTQFSQNTAVDGKHTLTQEEVFDLLSNQRRRLSLYYLKQVEESTIGEIADQVAAWENGVTAESISSTQRKRVYNSLQQTHLEKLAEAGLISYDSRSGDVEISGSAKELAGYLHATDHFAIYWSVYTLVLSSIGVGTVLTVQFGLFPAELLSPYGLLAFIVGTLTLSSVFYLLHERRRSTGIGVRPPEVETN